MNIGTSFKNISIFIILAILLTSFCFQSTFAGNNSWSKGADINNDGIVDNKDLAIVAKYWLISDPNREPNITWVDINDPGVSGHEGFIGQMSKYETTNEQYCQFLNASKISNKISVYNDRVYAISDTSHRYPYFFTYADDSGSQITYENGIFNVRTRDGYRMHNHPVTNVSWHGATAFCNYYGFRLPTEWEWQAVADYDGSYTYGCGITINKSKANCYFYSDHAYANPLHLTSQPYTSPVGYYPAYGYGLCDMAGNVYEWTDSYYYDSFDCEYLIVRGGSWQSADDICSVSHWSCGTKYDGDMYCGFRVCR